MGGMGAWEVGAQSPDLFAAICPVAAYHMKDRTMHIASRLRGTPLLVVHDEEDRTCPIAHERELWEILAGGGHTNVYMRVVQGVDHCDMFEYAYFATNRQSQMHSQSPA